jgi:aspartyl-tRNA(Asn)/glutamyl-tRNA(Gln) amidotransferase subunit A
VTIPETGRKLRAREVSSVELTQESLRRIRDLQPRLNAFITITEDLALEQARRADDELSRHIDRGPLHGIPYALKDNFDTAGIPTTCGSRIFADRRPDRNADIYTKIAVAGAVLTGKTGMHEFAYGITSSNSSFGDIRNPHDPTRIPGGSSGGSGVAVAAGLVFFAMGTDTGGSIRVPASYCGCVGFKPAYGTLRLDGVFPLGFSLDTVGPLTRTAADAAVVMNALTELPAPSPAQPRRIGVPQNFFTEGVSHDVASACDDALRRAERLGCRLIPVTVPDPAAINTIGRVILLAEASAVLQPFLNRRDDFGSDVLTLVEQGRHVSATDYIDAQRLRKVFQSRWETLWDEVDVVFTPTTPVSAPLIGQTQVDGEDVRTVSTKFVRPFNVLGLPALSIPFLSGALPIGLQMICRPGAEPQMLFLADLLAN